ncbi:hypothetical protein FYK55_19690 [Roseiconus nitratireducens]|uniref:Uncharacterized protein n=1 Tax=Roseiconus nitratireducens TaxID=2605748 RepID=A0A5M6D1C1_9BACT|nr:hypothetical protein [Roseiconus nitratireducens]KAA5541113.1 hypothetical protein FYK55_19690 [Roseiconus nitratireducens]
MKQLSAIKAAHPTNVRRQPIRRAFGPALSSSVSVEFAFCRAIAKKNGNRACQTSSLRNRQRTLIRQPAGSLYQTRSRDVADTCHWPVFDHRTDKAKLCSGARFTHRVFDDSSCETSMSNAFEPQTNEFDAPRQTSGSNRGCLWGCLIVAGLLISVVLCMVIGSYWFLTNQIAKYTSDQPVELPTVQYSEEELATLEARVESFRQKLESGETPEQDLVLTAEEINALIGKNEDLRGRVYVKIENGKVKGDVSFPLDNFPGGSGRFFNGSASFDVSMENGVLIVTADQAEVNGDPVPEAFMEGLRRENLARDVYKDPKNAKFMRQFKDIRIQDDKVILEVRRDGDVQTPADADSDDQESSAEEDAAGSEETSTEEAATPSDADETPTTE